VGRADADVGLARQPRGRQTENMSARAPTRSRKLEAAGTFDDITQPDSGETTSTNRSRALGKGGADEDLAEDEVFRKNGNLSVSFHHSQSEDLVLAVRKTGYTSLLLYYSKEALSVFQ